MLKMVLGLLSILLLTNIAYAQSNNGRIWQLAEQGDANAQFRLGLRYSPLHTNDNLGHCQKNEFYEGEKCYAKDAKHSFYWINLAAHNGEKQALNYLAHYYINGIGVEKNTELALKYYFESAELGYRGAQYNLGILYFRGEIIEADYQLAQYWFLKSLEQSYYPAATELVKLYLRQNTVNKIRHAVELGRKMNRLEPKNENTMLINYLLGDFYQSHSDNQQAVYWYNKALAAARFDYLTIDNKQKAMEYYQFLAIPHVQLHLAWLTLNGSGTKQDVKKAVELFDQAYRVFIQFYSQEDFIDLIDKSIDAALLEKRWLHMCLNIINGKVDKQADQQLFKELFPNQPKMLSEFYQQMETLKKHHH